MKMETWNIIHLNEIDSTMDYVKRNISALPDRSVIWADMQYKGRGRGKNTWLSPRGGLWFSVVLKSKDNTNPWHTMMTFSVALVRTLRRHSVDAWIKWPNDIYVERKKVAGILVENVIKGKPIAQVVGIGLNVNNDIDRTISDKATSLFLQMGKQISLSDLLMTILDEYDSTDSEDIYERWLRFSRLLGMDVELVDNSGVIHNGRVANLLMDGSIELSEKGDKKIYRAGSLILVHEGLATEIQRKTSKIDVSNSHIG